MTKQELLNDLLAKSWVNEIIGDPHLQETKPNGDKWYIVNIREVVDNACLYRNIHFYVIDEGEISELAYYKDKEPDKTIKSIT